MMIIIMKLLLNSSRRSLLVLLFLSFVYFLENFDRYLISVSPIPYIDYNSYEYSVLAGPAFTIIYTFSGLVIALSYEDVLATDVANKSILFSKFNVLMIATLVFSISFASTALASYFWQQLLIRLAMGLSQSIVTPFSTSIISDHFPSSIRGSAFGVFNAGTYFAFSLSLSLGTYIYVTYGWKFGYLVFGLVGILVSILTPFLSCYDYYMKHSKSLIQDDFTNGYTNTLLKRDSDGHVYNLLNTAPASNGGEDSSPLRVDPMIGSRGRDSDDQITSKTHIDSSVGGGINSKSNSDDVLKAFSSMTKSTSSISTQANSNLVFSCRSKWNKSMAILRDILCVHWSNHPGIYLLCIATGVRIGAGYVWSSYTSVFFSDLFNQQLDSTCDYSYNDEVTSVDTHIDVCGNQYPYCIDGSCNKLASYPWHNQGMKSLYLEEYMSWVPVVGSAFGSLLGSFLSDMVLQKISGPQQSSSIDNDATCTGESDGDAIVGEGSLSDASTGSSRPYTMVVGLEGGSGHSRKEIIKSDRPLYADQQQVGSNHLLVHLQDQCSESKSAIESNGNNNASPQAMRMLITACSNLLALPLIVFALQLDFPYCFLILIASGMVGELYLSQSLALLTHRDVIPEALITPSIALFMFIITIIGGNVPLLVTLFTTIVGYDTPVQLNFTAQSRYNGDPSIKSTTVSFSVDHTDAMKLQCAMSYVLGGCYGLSALLYLMSYRQMSRIRS